MHFCSFVSKYNQARIKYSPKCIYQIFTKMYLTVSIEPSNIESPTGFLQATLLLNTLTTYPHISLKKLFFLLPPQFHDTM